MSTADALRMSPGRSASATGESGLGAEARRAVGSSEAATAAPDVLGPDETRKRERFLPITRFALIDRLTRPKAWGPGDAAEARRFFRFLDYWRRQQYATRILELEQAYEPFSPDSDLLQTRQYTDSERLHLQKRVVHDVEHLLVQANYERIDPSNVQLILTQDSHYGLDLSVDLDAFEELLIYFRGATSRKEERRSLRKFMRKEEFEVPVFRRLFVLFKLKSEEKRIEEVMAKRGVTRKEAAKIVAKLRALIPTEVQDGNIYMKMFKNMPRSDIEMIFPNTRVRFRLMDKIKLGVTSGAGLGAGAFSAAGKIALAATNPVAAAGAVGGLGIIAFRQTMNFLNQRQRYMVIMAQNLYFHAMADNRGVVIKLADRAAEEDVKEEILLYSVLAKEVVNHRDLHAIDVAVEQYLQNAFGVHVDFDLEDALRRLIADGLVTEEPDGTLRTLPPLAAAQHLDRMWDVFLDHLPDPTAGEGHEIEDDEGETAVRPA